MNVIDKIEANPLMSSGLRLVKDIQNRFPGSEAYIVGGCVRDIVMGLEPHDIDIATNADIEAIARHYHSADIGKSRDFGIVLVLFEGNEFEVAHFRTEFGSEDNRHPDSVTSVNDFKADTDRRDITINAMGIDVEGNVIDHQGGLEDIRRGVIRCVGCANRRFKEDALRILRVARFAAKFDFHIDGETEKKMISNAHLVSRLSVERIHDELFKVASVSGIALIDFIELLDYVGVLEMILPEIIALNGLVHREEYHPEGDVYEHTNCALILSESTNPLVNLAILFHDIGKAKTQEFKEGKVSYHNHENVGVSMFDVIADRLKFSNEEREAIVFAIQNHMKFHTIDKIKKSNIVKLRQNKNYDILRQVAYCDDACRIGLFDEEDFNRRVKKIEDIFRVFGEKEEFENRMKVLINGRMIVDLAKELDVEITGKQIGMIKNHIRDMIVEKDFNIAPEEAEFETKRIILRIGVVNEFLKEGK